MKRFYFLFILIGITFNVFILRYKNDILMSPKYILDENIFLNVSDAIENNTMTREKFETAFKEVAWSFYMRGKYIQYNSQKTNATDSFYSPEEATSQNINYSVCSGYSYYIYNELLNLKIPHYTSNLITYSKNNVGKLGVVAYGKRTSTSKMTMTIYDEDNKKSITLSNPTLSSIVKYLKTGDVLTYTGHAMVVYDLIYDSKGIVTDAYIIESGHGNGNYKANTKINNGANHYLYHNSRLSNKLPILSNQEQIEEGSLHLNKLSLVSHWKELNKSTPNYSKEEYSIVRFATIKNNKLVLTYYDNENNGKEIELSSKTNDRIKYPRLFIEKTVNKHNDNVVSVKDELTYTIVIKNKSINSYSNEIVVTENISDYVDYTNSYTVSKSNITYKKISNKKLEFRISPMASNSEVTITYKVKVKDNVVGKEIKSTGKVGNIDSSVIRNIVGNSLNDNQTKTIVSSYNTLKNGNLTGKNLINSIYNSIGYDLKLNNFDIKELINNSKLSSTSSTTLTLNTKHYLYNAVLNKYYNSLANIDGKYDLKSFRKYSDSSRRADTIYKESFKTGDILIYTNKNDSTTNESGEYAYIYIEGQGFVGKNTNRNSFNKDYYTGKLKLYTNSDNETLSNVDNEFLEFINYQTLFGKDYYVILRPSLMMKSVYNIEVNKNPTKMTYIKNSDKLDLTGGIINIIYTDGTKETISMTDNKIKVSGFDNSKIGKNLIKFEYLEKTTSIYVEIKEKTPDIITPKITVTKIEVDTKPLKKTYLQNQENLDLTDGIIKVFYSDNTTEKIKMTDKGVSVSGFDNSKLGKKTIKLIFENKETSFSIEVIKKEVSKIEIEKLPDKITYYLNQEDLDLTGGIIKVVYNDKSSDHISMTNEDVIITGFDNTYPGDKTIELEYLKQKLNFNIQVIDNKIVNITLKEKPTNINRIINSKDSKFVGGILLIEYSDNFTKEVSLENEDTLVVEINKEKNMIIINYLDYQIPIEGTKNNNKSLIYVLVFGVTTIMSFIISLILKKKYKVKQ